MNVQIKQYGIPAAAGLAVVAGATFICPGARPLTAAVAYAVIATFVLIAWHACSWRSHAGAMVLLAAVAVLMVGAVLNVNYYTLGSGGSLTHPMLQNTDARLAWWGGVAIIADGARPLFRTAYPTCAMIWLFGRDIFLAIMPSTLCAALTLVATGELAWRLTRRRTVALTAMIAMSLMCYFMVQGTLLIKDTPVTLGMCLAALAMVRLRQNGAKAPAAAALLAAAVILAAIYRPNMLIFYAFGALILCFGRKFSPSVAASGAISLAAWVLTVVSGPENPDPLVLATGSPLYDFTHVKTAAWDTVTAHYSQFTFWHKLALLPASIVLQFLIPFPWNFARDMVFGPTLCVAHFGYTWYAAGGVLIFWFSGQIRRSPALMVRIALWAAALYVAIAFGFNGRVSRYCLPLLPLIMPAVALTLVECRRSRRFWIWMAVFATLMAVALVICHHLQTHIQ